MEIGLKRLRKLTGEQIMIKLIAKIVSPIALIVLIAPSLLFLSGRMELDQVKWIMLIATIIWFVAASLWMWDNEPKTQDDK
jgi:nitrate/nitrite transporter NarK